MIINQPFPSFEELEYKTLCEENERCQKEFIKWDLESKGVDIMTPNTPSSMTYKMGFKGSV